LALPHVEARSCNGAVALWYIRAHEQVDGSWACGWAGVDFGTLTNEVTLLGFLVALTTALGGRELFEIHLYRRNGRTDFLQASDPALDDTSA
jgi:hypothetical protein